MSEVTHNVQLEPQLHPLSGKNLCYRSAIQDDDARVDIRASGNAYTIIPFLMSGFSIALQPLIVLLHWPLFFESMNWRNVVLRPTFINSLFPITRPHAIYSHRIGNYYCN